jgi:hypothetical protein
MGWGKLVPLVGVIATITPMASAQQADRDRCKQGYDLAKFTTVDSMMPFAVASIWAGPQGCSFYSFYARPAGDGASAPTWTYSVRRQWTPRYGSSDPMPAPDMIVASACKPVMAAMTAMQTVEAARFSVPGLDTWRGQYLRTGGASYRLWTSRAHYDGQAEDDGIELELESAVESPVQRWAEDHLPEIFACLERATPPRGYSAELPPEASALADRERRKNGSKGASINLKDALAPKP